MKKTIYTVELSSQGKGWSSSTPMEMYAFMETEVEGLSPGESVTVHCTEVSDEKFAEIFETGPEWKGW